MRLPILPSETVVGGLENAAETQRPSDVFIARYEAIARLYAAAIVAKRETYDAVVGCEPTTEGCDAQFIASAGRRIFRRPLTDDEQARFQARFTQWKALVEFDGALELTLSAMLQSPQFIYRPELAASAATGTTVPVEPYAMASRLSFFLWESGPDEALLKAAASGELVTPEQIAAQATRMMADPKIRRLYWNFHRQWLGLDRILQDEHAVRTAEVDATWSSLSQTSALEESKRFIANELFDSGSFRSLFTSKRSWVDGEMARLYGLPAPVDRAAWVEVAFDGTQRSGLLSRVAFLAGFSHRGATSPPIRANELQLRLLCQLPRPPPADLDTSVPKQPAEGVKTNRTLFEERTAPATCAGCHLALNGFGFGFEHYNAAGKYQVSDHGLPVDSTGTVVGTDVDRPFDGAMDLSQALSESALVHQCATQLWLRYAMGRSLVDAELPWFEQVSAGFMADKGDVQKLIVSIVSSPNFRRRPAQELE